MSVVVVAEVHDMLDLLLSWLVLQRVRLEAMLPLDRESVCQLMDGRCGRVLIGRLSREETGAEPDARCREAEGVGSMRSGAGGRVMFADVLSVWKGTLLSFDAMV